MKKWLFLALVFTGATSAQASDYPQLTPSAKMFPGRVRISPNVDYLDTDANFDSSGGTFEKIGGDRSYKVYDVDFMGEFQLTSRWAFTSRFGFAAAESYDGTFTRTNSGPTEIGAGIRYQLMSGPLAITPDVEILFPLNRVESDTDEVMTGEGAMAVRGGLWLRGRVWRFDNFAYVGMTYRDEGRSSLLPWRLGTQLKLGHWSLGGEISGFESITDDENTNTPGERNDVTARVNGGSFQYYSINPSIMNARGWVGWQMTRQFGLNLGYGASIDGKNSAHNSVIFLRADLQFGVPAMVSKGRSSERRQQNRSKKFSVESENYDETLFEDEQPRRRQRRQREENIDVDQLLNETQESLE